MTTFYPAQTLPPAHFDPLHMAAAAYLARFKGQTRVHTESDLRAYMYWCADRALDPFAATRPHIELYVRWMQEHRRYAAPCPGGWQWWPASTEPASSTASWSIPLPSMCAGRTFLLSHRLWV